MAATPASWRKATRDRWASSKPHAPVDEAQALIEKIAKLITTADALNLQGDDVIRPFLTVADLKLVRDLLARVATKPAVADVDGAFLDRLDAAATWLDDHAPSEHSTPWLIHRDTVREAGQRLARVAETPKHDHEWLVQADYDETNERKRASVARVAERPQEQETGVPVIQRWACSLPLRMQSTMLLSMRGPDGCSKHNTAKVLLRQLRSAVLVPAFPGTPDSFMGDQRGFCEWVEAEAFLDDHDEYPHHWLMHFIHAAEIVGQFHPSDDVRAFWWRLYLALCESFHLRNESIDELSTRLADPAVARVGESTPPDLRGVLLSLRNEASAVLLLAESELRQVIGHTNVNCLRRRIDAADKALAVVPPVPPVEPEQE